MDTLFGALVVLILIGVPVYLFGAMVYDIRRHRRDASSRKRILKNFSLSLVLSFFFLLSWSGQALAQWREFVADQRAHEEAVKAGEFLMQFGASTLENWQSEFLQLFSFVVLSALFIHKGSGESKDGDERMEAMLERIVKKLDA